MGERPTPFRAIDRYAARAGIEDPDDFERFKTIMAVMDGAFLSRRKPEEGEGPRVSMKDATGVKSFLQRFKKKK